MAQFQCESCHGPGGEHEKEPLVGKKRAPIVAFGKESSVSSDTQNKICLQCHTDDKRMVWHGSSHASQGMLCVDCHYIHKRHDPVLSKTKQADVCYNCHKKQQAEFERTSVHPVRYGKMQCTQCHNPHGSYTDSLLVANTKNATCYRCHAEKRGPFLWAHAPVSEDCGICHEFHGSNTKPLLKQRAPWLCQQCHGAGAHANRAYNPDAADGGSFNAPFVLAKSCLNCHFQVHGSNHPSGAKLTR
jgi:DmsE family decaheme c-type cytochrome